MYRHAYIVKVLEFDLKVFFQKSRRFQDDYNSFLKIFSAKNMALFLSVFEFFCKIQYIEIYFHEIFQGSIFTILTYKIQGKTTKNNRVLKCSDYNLFGKFQLCPSQNHKNFVVGFKKTYHRIFYYLCTTLFVATLCTAI